MIREFLAIFQIFQIDLFFLNFLICPPNCDLDILTRSNLMWDTLYNQGYNLVCIELIFGGCTIVYWMFVNKRNLNLKLKPNPLLKP